MVQGMDLAGLGSGYVSWNGSRYGSGDGSGYDSRLDLGMAQGMHLCMVLADGFGYGFRYCSGHGYKGTDLGLFLEGRIWVWF